MSLAAISGEEKRMYIPLGSCGSWKLLTFSLITAGVLAEKAPPHLRLTSAAYALMFLAIGQSFDRYWGLLPWPTWMLACGFGADAILSAVRVLVDNDPQTTTNVAGSVPGRTTG